MNTVLTLETANYGYPNYATYRGVDKMLQVKLLGIADTPLSVAARASFLPATLLCNCGAFQIVAGWLDNILQVGAWLTGDPEHEFYRIAPSLRAFQSMSRGQYFASWNYAHALTASLRLVGRRGPLSHT